MRKSNELALLPNPLSGIASHSPCAAPSTMAENPSTGCDGRRELDAVVDHVRRSPVGGEDRGPTAGRRRTSPTGSTARPTRRGSSPPWPRSPSATTATPGTRARATAAVAVRASERAVRWTWLLLCRGAEPRSCEGAPSRAHRPPVTSRSRPCPGPVPGTKGHGYHPPGTPLAVPSEGATPWSGRQDGRARRSARRRWRPVVRRRAPLVACVAAAALVVASGCVVVALRIANGGHGARGPELVARRLVRRQPGLRRGRHGAADPRRAAPARVAASSSSARRPP